MVLINLGVHKLESYKNNQGIFENSYFIHRPYLNYLIFSPKSTEMFYDYFNSKGGVGKQLFTNVGQIGHSQAKIFTKYGASVLLTNPKGSDFNPNFKTEFYGQDFADKDISFPWKKPESLYWFILSQKEKNFLIVDEHIIIKEGEWFPNIEFDYSDEMIRDISAILDHDIDYVLPRLHSGDFYLQKLSKSSLQEKVHNFIGRLR